MAAGLRGRLSLVCSPRWLQGWHLPPGRSGERLAHAGAAAQLQREYDAVVIGAGNRAREQEPSCREQAGTHICPPPGQVAEEQLGGEHGSAERAAKSQTAPHAWDNTGVWHKLQPPSIQSTVGASALSTSVPLCCTIRARAVGPEEDAPCHLYLCLEPVIRVAVTAPCPRHDRVPCAVGPSLTLGSAHLPLFLQGTTGWWQ